MIPTLPQPSMTEVRGLTRLTVCALDVPDTALPQAAREAMAMLAAHVRDTDAKIDALKYESLNCHRADATSQRCATISGIGPLIASAIVAIMGDPRRCKTGRDFAAWLGLVPSPHSTGGETVPGPITKAGDRYLRSLLVVIATSTLWWRSKMASGQSAAETGWTHDGTRPGRESAKISLQRRGRPHRTAVVSRLA